MKEQYTMRGLTENVWGLMNECWQWDPANRPTISQASEWLAAVQPLDDRPRGEWESGVAMQKEEIGDTSLPLTMETLDTILLRELSSS